MHQPASVDVLRKALADLPPSAYAGDRSELGDLHQKVCNVVDELKAAGLSPEHVLLAVKGVAFDAMMGSFAAILVDKMVQWCLEQYFKK